MRKMKKINGFLVVKFNARELREWEGTALGNYGVIDEELYTGKLEIDRGSMEYDNIETIEEAVEMARGLYTEEDYNEQPSTYAVVEAAGETVVERVTVEPQSMIDGWTKSLKEQIKSPHYPGVNANTARHELYGFKVALTELGLLDSDACLVLPNAFGPEELLLYQEPEELLAYICDKVCKERIPGRTQEELDAVCAKCEVNRLAAAPALTPPPEPRAAFRHIGNGGGIARETYALGLKLSKDCPMNDCHLYLNIFNMCRELDEQIDRVEGWPRKLLEMELKRKYLELEKMFMLNYAVKEYKHGRRAPASVKAPEEPEAALRMFTLEYQETTYQQPGETAETAKRHLCLRLGDDPNEKTIFEAVKVLNEEAGSPEE